MSRVRCQVRYRVRCRGWAAAGPVAGERIALWDDRSSYVDTR